VCVCVCVCVCFTMSAPEELWQAQVATWWLETEVTNTPATSAASVNC